MPTPQTALYLAPDLAINLKWSAGVATFTQERQHRIQVAEVSGAQAKEHMMESASMVLGAVEQLSERTAQILTDLYRFRGQLPVPTDKILVGPLELRVEGRQFEVGHSGGIEQVAVAYCLNIVRYRYETTQTVPFSVVDFLVTV